ncbi:sodium channel, voltage-gated, type I, beta a [Tachysurus vachellii]|uniref:sodium channel, voltage-gated, type I, beta a n=1 Tax=Tachysurus vachellii TaxID=175792 RepID=UPI00296ADF26|nr:sodium channel, voltage-gated, type I, beta a [Tachysurus vachellii]XP_060718275.1 sodium channel, voltage-gated, type I, beta a [Tachysurus vachellii]XP_060718276.1 sodium channel, voltage-gated, type I, beta a [Tachysurus vachellii]
MCMSLSWVKMTAVQVMWLPLLLLCILQARLSSSACVEVDSDTEAVAGQDFRLGCISCKMRGEVEATATVDWWFMAKGESDFTHIYSYSNEMGLVTDERFLGRVEWAGSKKTLDLQDGSLKILNVTFNDTGTYRCYFDRTLSFTYYEFHTNATKFITINVVAKETRGMASILSEVMMYVSIIGLQLWLLVEMVYCYRKIAAAGEEALRESAAEYLAITSESKDNCTGVAVAE